MIRNGLKMELLNSEEMNLMNGGFSEFSEYYANAGCTKTGDTIFKECAGGVDYIMVLCVNYEAKCPVSFSNTCGNGDINCSKDFSTGPK